MYTLKLLNRFIPFSLSRSVSFVSRSFFCPLNYSIVAAVRIVFLNCINSQLHIAFDSHTQRARTYIHTQTHRTIRIVTTALMLFNFCCILPQSCSLSWFTLSLSVCVSLVLLSRNRYFAGGFRQPPSSSSPSLLFSLMQL